jgi:hypothetical protein
MAHQHHIAVNHGRDGQWLCRSTQGGQASQQDQTGFSKKHYKSAHWNAEKNLGVSNKTASAYQLWL